MPNLIIPRGAALSTYQYSGSASETNKPMIVDQTIDVNAGHNRAIRIQGFRWTGDARATITDAQGTVLFQHVSTSHEIFPKTASGSYGLTCNAPLYLSTSIAGVAGGGGPGGGILTIYGEVL